MRHIFDFLMLSLAKREESLPSKCVSRPGFQNTDARDLQLDHVTIG